MFNSPTHHPCYFPRDTPSFIFDNSKKKNSYARKCLELTALIMFNPFYTICNISFVFVYITFIYLFYNRSNLTFLDKQS
uniref:Uncharacterized protein n=1 Tax=Lepeophtheirus salmonis TaxID=72036 RepID=A0A0K2T6C5_LEPSM